MHFKSQGSCFNLSKQVHTTTFSSHFPCTRIEVLTLTKMKNIASMAKQHCKRQALSRYPIV